MQPLMESVARNAWQSIFFSTLKDFKAFKKLSSSFDGVVKAPRKKKSRIVILLFIMFGLSLHILASSLS